MFLFIIPDSRGAERRLCAACAPIDASNLIVVPLGSEGMSLSAPTGELLRCCRGEFLPQDFEVLFEKIEQRTLIFADRMKVIYDCCREVQHLDGMAAEIGVFRGGSIDLIASVLGDRVVHGFDTFSGFHQKEHSKDLGGSGLPNLTAFSDLNFNDVITPLRHQNIRLHKGFFPLTAKWIQSEDRFCLVHFDADLYEVALDCLNTFYPLMVPGGKMIFDDYDFEYFPGVKKAVDEFFADKPEEPVRTHLIQCVVTKE